MEPALRIQTTRLAISRETLNMKIRSLTPALFLWSAILSPADAADKVFDSNSVKIHYVSEGKGDPVILIHGWMGDSSMWGRDRSGNTKLDAEVAKEFRLIALDCRGHGKSDKLYDKEKYGPEMAADVVRLLDHLKIPKAHLIGYSMGTYIAAKVVATHPDRVLSITYGGQAPIIGDTKIAKEVEVFAKAVEEGKGLESYIIEVTPKGRKKPTEEEAKIAVALLFGGKDVKAFAAAGRSFPDLKVTEAELKKCKAPILFIHGSEEVASTKDRVAALQKVLEKSKVKVISGADHITTLTKPEFRSTILEFLRANKQK
jgi:pimeloyl-ACP methyl ester carboxylesterase